MVLGEDRLQGVVRALWTGVGRLLRGVVALALVCGLCAALPWALVRFVGWPLPDHVPTLAELGEALTRTPSTNFLLDVLACCAWLLWFAFLVEVVTCAREVVQAAGRLDVAGRAGPLRRIAAVLITAIVVSFVDRSAVAAPRGVQASSGSSAAAPTPVDRTSVDVELVRPPRNGIHDSLYRIAQRRLGDGNRWPEIWQLNVMSTQSGGRKLTSPSLVHPGDRVRLPTTVRPGDPKTSHDSPPRVPPREQVTGQTADPPTPVQHEVSWRPDLFVGLGLAGAISAVLVAARRRRRAEYRPGSGRRDDDLPVAPVVYRLHLAHQRARNDLEDADLDIVESGAVDLELGEPADDAAAALALDLARSQGLGLVGPGGHAAARALLLTAMATRHVDVVAPGPDLSTLLGVSEQEADLPPGLHVVHDLAAAVEHLESQIVAGQSRRGLLASAPTSDDHRLRLQGLLADCPEDTTVLLLGQWALGPTIYVNATGAITATSPGAAEPLRGRRAFSLPESATRELFALLHAGDEPERERPECVAEPAGQLEIEGHPPRRSAGPVKTEVRMRQVGEVERDTAKPLVLSVFGQPRLSWRPDVSHPDHKVEITGRLSRRLWELLICLALRPDGAPRNAVIDSLWAGRAVRNPSAVLRTVVSRVRGLLDEATSGAVGDVVVAEHGRYRLAPALVEVDYWAFAAAVTRRKSATSEDDRLAAHAAAVASYGGELAAGFDAEWLTALREGVRRDALDAVAALARGRVRSDPEGTLELLETARDLDPHNELLYRDIMRLEHNLGRHDAIARTLRLLEARLAEIDESPTAATIELAERLRALHVGLAGPAA